MATISSSKSHLKLAILLESILSNVAFREISTAQKGRRSRNLMHILLPRTMRNAGIPIDGVIEVMTSPIDFGPVGGLMGRIGLAEAISLKLTHETQTFPLEIVALMKDETAAGVIVGGVNILKSASSLILRDHAPDPVALESFKSLEAIRDGRTVRLTLAIREENLLRVSNMRNGQAMALLDQKAEALRWLGRSGGERRSSGNR